MPVFNAEKMLNHLSCIVFVLAHDKNTIGGHATWTGGHELSCSGHGPTVGIPMSRKANNSITITIIVLHTYISIRSFRNNSKL